jgi:hypothetical protein
MNEYFLNINEQNSNAGSNYELHKSSCPYCDTLNPNFISIGNYYTDEEALIMAKYKNPKIADKIDGCAKCCPSINEEK